MIWQRVKKGMMNVSDVRGDVRGDVRRDVSRIVMEMKQNVVNVNLESRQIQGSCRWPSTRQHQKTRSLNSNEHSSARFYITMLLARCLTEQRTLGDRELMNAAKISNHQVP